MQLVRVHFDLEKHPLSAGFVEKQIGFSSVSATLPSHRDERFEGFHRKHPLDLLATRDESGILKIGLIGEEVEPKSEPAFELVETARSRKTTTGLVVVVVVVVEARARQAFGLSLARAGLSFWFWRSSLRSRLGVSVVGSSSSASPLARFGRRPTMTNLTTLPHEGLFAYRVARELVVAVRAARISDSGLRDQALRAAMSVCLNIAEAAGRPGLADQRRVYGIARGETCEVAAALDVAAAAGFCAADAGSRGRELAGRAYALLSGLMRRGMK